VIPRGLGQRRERRARRGRLVRQLLTESLVLALFGAQRARDIGIRMALGAQRGSVVGMIVAQGMTQVAAGLALGFALAFAISRLAGGLLIGTSPTDPVAFLAAPLLLAAVALASIYAPARRATRVDPTLALRGE
jgi:putative ABC transport system permease protein